MRSFEARIAPIDAAEACVLLRDVTLEVHSDGPGKGATFTLELPFRPETDARGGALRAGG